MGERYTPEVIKEDNRLHFSLHYFEKEKLQ